MNLRPALLLACALAACATTPKGRQRIDEIRSDPAIATGEIVDLAVLPPDVDSTGRFPFGKRMREAARKYLIDVKNYAVADDRFVDSSATLDEMRASPEAMAERLGADAVLLIRVTQWEIQDLLSRGRVYAGGSATAYGQGKVLWERIFADWAIHAPGAVTPSNRAEMSDALAAILTHELLEKFPPKPIR
jgi:hypothetical protein